MQKTGKHLNNKDSGNGYQPYKGSYREDQKNSAISTKNLEKKIKKLERKIDNLEDQIEPLGSASSGTDSITGLEPGIKNLGNAVKLDIEHPSSNPNTGIDYDLNRDREAIISRIKNSISPLTDWSQDNNIDLMATIDALTARVENLEG